MTATTEAPFEQVYGTPTSDCNADDFFPVLDFLETLDREALGIIVSGDDAWDGRCGAFVEAYFDTTELREALEPMADRITTFFLFTPVE
ncbi:MAG: hypothetical protein WA964_01925 [Ilumatobacter sp.]|uniref:hypothetical protein n=1 Tax=Ilumatobacter sp. TaxID=1967498 RepID=UPI003C710D6A